MKNIIKYVILAAVTISFSSCDDELEQVPFDELGIANAFNTANDFENALRGAYQGLILPGMYGSSDNGSVLSIGDVMSDNVTPAQVGRNTKVTLHNWNYDTNSTAVVLYNDAYSTIYRANLVLDNSVSFDGDIENIIAEAKALRALAHFNLVTLWGKIPTQSSDANGSLGIAYVTNADPQIEPARNTVAEVYDNIVTDLTEAAASINATNGEGRMGANAVNTLLSRVYLYMGRWQDAIDAAETVSEGIASRANFVALWEDGNDDGLVFSIPNDIGILGNQIGVTWAQGTPNALIAEYVASFELFNLFADGDIRKEAYILDAGNGGNDFNGIKKLYGRRLDNGNLNNNGIVDYKIFRAAESRLNAAEAYFMLGQEGPALAALNELRQNRYETPPNGETGTALSDAIMLERRLEFAFEYQRFFDLKRKALGITRQNTGEFADGSGTPSEDLNLPAGSDLFQLPFAQSSLDTNPNLVQNPGY